MELKIILYSYGIGLTEKKCFLS